MSTWEDIQKKKAKQKNSVVPQVHTTFVYDPTGKNGEGLDPNYNTQKPQVPATNAPGWTASTQLARDIASKGAHDLATRGAAYTLDPNRGVQNTPYIGNTSVGAQNGGTVTAEEVKEVLKKNGIYYEEPEDKEARERRQRMAIGWTALAQGLSSLSNLFFTTKGAPEQKIQDVLGPTFDKVTETNNFYERQQKAIEIAQRQKEEAAAQAEKDAEREKQDKIDIYNVQAKIDEGKAKRKADIDAALIRLRNELAIGRLDLAHYNKLAEIYKRGDIQKAIETQKSYERERLARVKAEIKARTGSSNYADTAIDENGTWWNRTKVVSKNTIKQVVNAYAEQAGLNPEDYRQLKKDEYGRLRRIGEVNYQDMYNDLINGGYVPGDVLQKIGFTPSSSAPAASVDDTSSASSGRKSVNVSGKSGSTPTPKPKKKEEEDEDTTSFD